MFNSTERWMSGLSRTPGKRVYVNSVSRVRIPSSLPDSKKPVLIKTGFFLAFNSGGRLLQSLFEKKNYFYSQFVIRFGSIYTNQFCRCILHSVIYIHKKSIFKKVV